MSWLRAVRRWQWLLAAGVLVGAVAGGYAGYRLQHAEVTSTSQILVTGQASNDQSDSAYTSNQYVNQRMSTYAQIASSDQVTRPAATALGTDPGSLATKITAAVQEDTTVLTLAVQSSTPVQAQRNGIAVTRAFIEAVIDLETLSGGSPRVSLDVISDPTLPGTRFLAPIWVWMLAGAFGVVLFGVLGVLLLRWLYPRRWPVNGRGESTPPAPGDASPAPTADEVTPSDTHPRDPPVEETQRIRKPGAPDADITNLDWTVEWPDTSDVDKVTAPRPEDRNTGL